MSTLDNHDDERNMDFVFHPALKSIGFPSHKITLDLPGMTGSTYENIQNPSSTSSSSSNTSTGHSVNLSCTFYPDYAIGCLKEELQEEIYEAIKQEFGQEFLDTNNWRGFEHIQVDYFTSQVMKPFTYGGSQSPLQPPIHNEDIITPPSSHLDLNLRLTIVYTGYFDRPQAVESPVAPWRAPATIQGLLHYMARLMVEHMKHKANTVASRTNPCVVEEKFEYEISSMVQSDSEDGKPVIVLKLYVPWFKDIQEAEQQDAHPVRPLSLVGSLAVAIIILNHIAWN